MQIGDLFLFGLYLNTDLFHQMIAKKNKKCSVVPIVRVDCNDKLFTSYVLLIKNLLIY